MLVSTFRNSARPHLEPVARAASRPPRRGAVVDDGGDAFVRARRATTAEQRSARHKGGACSAVSCRLKVKRRHGAQLDVGAAPCAGEDTAQKDVRRGRSDRCWSTLGARCSDRLRRGRRKEGGASFGPHPRPDAATLQAIVNPGAGEPGRLAASVGGHASSATERPRPVSGGGVQAGDEAGGPGVPSYFACVEPSTDRCCWAWLKAQ